MAGETKIFTLHLHLLLPMLFLSSSTANITPKPSSQIIPRTPPPLPILPLPSASQLAWQQGEMAMFLHFGPNTFTDSEWGSGHADPSIFFPKILDSRQWAAVAAATGFSRVVLTAKHHDGFCLWPSSYTNYSVRSSPWSSGEGDVVADLAAAAHEFGLGFGIYLSPWDRHEPCYGKSLEYNEYFLGQMAELLTRYSLEGDPYGHDWVAPECDVSIRTGWFWHSSENPKSPMTLLDIYYTSVGRNCLLILNVPPNSSGLISDEDIQVLQNFTAMRRTIFSQNLAKDAIVSASSTRGGPDESHFSPSNVIEEGIYSYWAPDEFQATWTLILDLGQSMSFNVLQVQEPIQMGQRVIEFHADVLKEGEWKIIANGTTIGYKRLLLFPIVKAQFLRFVVDKSRADPLISYLGIYFDPFSPSHILLNTSRGSSFNNIRAIDLRASKNSSHVSVI